MDKITTTNLADFGFRELEMAGDLLKAIKDLPEEFDDDGVQVMMNFNSGNVFLTNSDCQVAMFNDGKLEMFYTCPNCGNEGFADEILTKSGKCEECKEQVKEG